MAIWKPGFSADKTSIASQDGKSFLEAFQPVASDWNVAHTSLFDSFLATSPVIIRQEHDWIRVGSLPHCR